jgi:hypothetical protein
MVDTDLPTAATGRSIASTILKALCLRFRAPYGRYCLKLPNAPLCRDPRTARGGMELRGPTSSARRRRSAAPSSGMRASTVVSGRLLRAHCMAQGD